mmetsp:Transcript_14914/g.23722  ORF Transcript_14914/g.23722 Transcript_14914/m.23722 type:complete len:202 (-) Transcript_14914:2036-2641(-)
MTSCLKSMLRIAVLSLCAMSALAAFNWDRCDKVNGPEQWAGLCGDKEQSPIDVCGATDNTNVQIAALQFAAGYATDKVYKFRSDGQAYIDASTLGLSMTAGQLAQTVGRSTNSANDTWNLAQAHFHWGRDKTDGSEHYIEGEQYTLELHFGIVRVFRVKACVRCCQTRRLYSILEKDVDSCSYPAQKFLTNEYAHTNTQYT